MTLLHVFEDEAEESPLREMAASERVIEHLTEDRPVASLDTETRRGDVAAEILNAAEINEVDSIVLGGRKRLPMGSLLFGSVTTDVLLHADCPVTVTGDSLVEEREDSPLMREEQDDVYANPRRTSPKIHRRIHQILPTKRSKFLALLNLHHWTGIRTAWDNPSRICGRSGHRPMRSSSGPDIHRLIPKRAKRYPIKPD